MGSILEVNGVSMFQENSSNKIMLMQMLSLFSGFKDSRFLIKIKVKVFGKSFSKITSAKQWQLFLHLDENNENKVLFSFLTQLSVIIPNKKISVSTFGSEAVFSESVLWRIGKKVA